MHPSFIWKMAWRDSRSSRRRLLVFSISITLGIAALVSIGSFRKSLAQAIDDQARALIGADLIVESSRAFSSDEEAFLHSLGEPQAREVRFSTMATFSGGTRLAHVRALGGDFPFYGTMETDPPHAARDFRQGNSAIVEESLLIQFGAKVGDQIKIGDVEFTVAGALKKMPGEASAAGSFAPRVYIPLQDLTATNLLKPGSVARYRNYVKFPAGVDAEARIATVVPQLQRFGLEYDTVAKRKRDLGAALDNLYRFLNLVGFISLLLGAVGVASAIQAHLQQKQKTGAILRCLGASAGATVFVYLLQAAAMGLVGAVAGAALGLAMQRIFPEVLKSFLPLPISATIAWQPVMRGMFVGFGICVLFALPALLRFRRLSPLLILRSGIEDKTQPQRADHAVRLVYVLMAASVTAFAISQTDKWWRGLIFAAVLGLAILIFAGVAKLLIVMVRRFFPHSWSFALRQGLANLYRPNNRTLLLTISLGLGTFLLLNLYLSREVLLSQFKSIGGKDQPNIFLFDIQPDQTDGVAEIVRSLGLPVIQQAPIVTMRLSAIKSRLTSDLLADPNRKIPEWELQREYRSTYRETLAETEKIVAGQWIGRVDYKPGDVVPISVDKEIARDWDAKVGDELSFDVQGVPIKTKISSLREIDWKRFQTNFFVVFPAGVLESAPTFNVLVSRVPDAAASAKLQNAVVAKFSNVSALDLTSVIQTVDSILTKVALVIRVMSLFTVGAGLIVLASTIWSGRYQRLKESVLLRTLGASRAQIYKILCAEYLALGLLASISGILLAVVSSWALAKFVFKLDYAPSLSPLFVAVSCVSALTVAIGLLTSRGIGTTPPLEILRTEVE
ncbi:MAG: ABC transporter permease [Verrucomicrobiota bacterium]|nr:ABC transporter permease [Verrucomicrobiota bacterium]MDQ6940593.1 ABC transporter permease [Verrucomicrobiota bacterium]